MEVTLTVLSELHEHVYFTVKHMIIKTTVNLSYVLLHEKGCSSNAYLVYVVRTVRQTLI